MSIKPAPDLHPITGIASSAAFDYDEAFSRNLGWLTPREQTSLRHARVALAGLGGAGGVHLQALARLGIGKFHLADFDLFELKNFNRQACATMTSLGHPKVEAAAGMAHDINPEAELTLFHEGVQKHNLDAFLDGVDVLVDGVDLYAYEARRMLFAECKTRGIPIICAIPLGMGAAVAVFLPNGPSFDEHFRLTGHDPASWPMRLALGLAPSMLHRSYLVYPEIVDLAGGRLPSTGLGCQIAAGMAATEISKLLLRRGRVRGAPWTLQFDAYTGRMRWCWRPGGNANPLQRMMLAYAQHKLTRMQRAATK